MATGNENLNRSFDNTNTNIVDSTTTTPLLSGPNSPRDESRRSLRRQSLREAARFLRRASSRRMMREPSMLVRETAAEQLEERQSDWAYSKPVVVLDMIWNLAFVAVAVAVLVLSRNETPSVPLRLWILGYALQCLLHMVCVTVEFRRRVRSRGQVSLVEESLGGGGGGVSGAESAGSSVGGENGSHYATLPQLEEEGNSVAKHLESANTMFSFIWWIIGFYWVSAGGQALATDSPQLYWLCIIFLAFDVFFVVFCVALACVIGIAVCCCLPCIIAILYAVADQEGASKEEVEQLTKYKFHRIGDVEKLSGEIQGSSGGIMTECNTDSPTEHVLSEEDAECCICLSSYDDGVDLRELPCGHHFHCACVDKWLFINATCPLCKYNILKSTSHHGREEV
uniref:RING-type E3 ubiquitin transferase n=1 Tax=Kalanchoe fedtschenkoi TaxID=63787 RepID=A0A7N0U147_KALFE